MRTDLVCKIPPVLGTKYAGRLNFCISYLRAEGVDSALYSFQDEEPKTESVPPLVLIYQCASYADGAVRQMNY